MFFSSPLVVRGLLAVILFGLFVSPSLAEGPNAHVETRIPNRGAVEVPNGEILDFLKLQDRLNGVALRVANAAEGRCANRWRYPGFQTHKVTDYPRRMRRGAKSFAEKTPTVLATTTAYLAGQILPGDQIVDAQGRPLDDDSQALQIELALGRVNLSRAGEKLTVTGTWPQLCYRPVRLTSSQTVKASTTPNGVEVSKGLVEYVRSDDELAYAIAHELSHFMLDHSRRLAEARSEGRLSPFLRRKLEIDADRGAVFLMHRAGYDVRGHWPSLIVRVYCAISRYWAYPATPGEAIVYRL